MAAYHTIVPGISIVLGLALLIYSVFIGAYTFLLVWLLWIFVARGIRSYTHLKKHPKDIILLPAVTAYFYVLSFIKIYAFFTMTNESWLGSRDNYSIKGGIRTSVKEPIKKIIFEKEKEINPIYRIKRIAELPAHN